jgi:uncharacterized membrane protein
MGFLYQLIGAVPDEIKVLFIATVPVLELRASIPVGFGLGMDWRWIYILSVIGNLIPVPFIIVFMRPLFSFLRETRLFKSTICWFEKRTHKKAETVLKYSAFGLFLFVAVPLPGTGAWTGAMIAAVLDMRMRYALPAIIIGVLAAGIAVTALSFGIFAA